tara:strand:- start:525 stop:1139 length:615 start_codon:yes stop_codon:yes gene_type:complete
MSITIEPPEFVFPDKLLFSRDTNFHEYKDECIEWMRQYSFKHSTWSKSNCGGYQSPDQFYLEESFAPFLNRFCEHLRASIDAYANPDDCAIEEIDNIRISNMWFNFNYQHSYNTTHVHPGSVLAGVLFLHVPEDSGELVFEADNQWAHALVNSDASKGIVPEEGGLILFPSYLPHRVTANENKNNEMRVSMAFNLADLPIPPVS